MADSSTYSHFFYMAPIRGVTDALFRTVYHNHFPFFDAAVAPFVNPQKYANLKDKFIIDVLPENNTVLPVVPQLLYNNSDDFIKLGKRLEGLGYDHLNWNLGCPAPMVANKKRGSGLLPHGDRILKMLDEIIPALNAEISIKTRLGFHQPTDFPELLPKLERYPLKEIIIHPRIGKQLYRGSVNLEGFAQCAQLTNHRLVYNGDICRPDDFKRLSAAFTAVNHWMIGRGAIADPFLLADIRGTAIAPEQRVSTIVNFHSDLYQQLKDRLNGPGHLLNRMKQIWLYLIESFPQSAKKLKKIQKASSEDKYWATVSQIFEEQQENSGKMPIE